MAMTLNIAVILVCLVWIVSEIILARVRHSEQIDSKERDKSSLRFLWMAILTSVTLGILVGLSGIGFTPVKGRLASVSGLVLIVLGLSVRWTAILTLKRYFTVDVSIVSGQQIISQGIYKIIRHPAYAGSLLSFLGLGVSYSNWLSMLVIFIPVLAAFLNRIRVEEKALTEVFGNEYTEYCKKTKRLVPGIY